MYWAPSMARSPCLGACASYCCLLSSLAARCEAVLQYIVPTIISSALLWLIIPPEGLIGLSKPPGKEQEGRNAEANERKRKKVLGRISSHSPTGGIIHSVCTPSWARACIFPPKNVRTWDLDMVVRRIYVRSDPGISRDGGSRDEIDLK